MSGKAINLGLLVLVVLQVATGIGAFLAGVPQWQIVVWLHAVGGFTIVLLFYWKRRIIVRSLTRQPLGPRAMPGLALLTLVLAALATGIGWSTVGLPYIGGYNPITIHVALGIGALITIVFHGQMHWPRVRGRDAPGRRALLRGGLVIGAATAAWRATEAGSSVLGLSGASRRFTGSRRADSSGGNDFPTSNWLFDNPDPLDLSRWQLRLNGHVQTPLTFAINDIAPAASLTALLDCTGGWYSEQNWSGLSLSSLLDAAGVRPGARSVVVRASTGYWRRYTLAEARGALRATHGGGAALSHNHGAPMRLVMPGKRGFEWVKWVTAIEVSTASPLLKWPLPIS
ncbi:MAG: molybdopterin-dependent oxidoreductase [Dehalococcoidia bacterium]